jgi:hypothetical protein
MRLVAFTVAFLAAGLAMAGELEGEGLRRAIVGKTVSLSTPMGDLPINYRADGTMQGSAGVLASYAGAARDTGRWWVVADQLCQRWNKWLDGVPHCFRLRQQGPNVHWTRDDGVTGMATIARQ